MRKLIIFSTLLLLSAVVGCMPRSSKDGHLYIISTNDVHATIDALPRLATLVAVYEERGEVLLVDSGDRVSGNAYVDDAAEPGVPLI
jgi:5'-nucleotidase